jgi:hypothetical protein
MIILRPLPGNGYFALLRIWVLSKRWLAIDVCSASDIPAFRQHATIFTKLISAQLGLVIPAYRSSRILVFEDSNPENNALYKMFLQSGKPSKLVFWRLLSRFSFWTLASRTDYILFLFSPKEVGQGLNIMIENKSFLNAEEFRHVWTKLTNRT